MTYSESKFTVGVEIGTPPTLATFILDTASSWTWVTSKYCDGCPSNRFNSIKSDSYESGQRAPITVHYPNGWIEGNISYETFAYGGFVVTDMPFLLGTKG